MVQVVNGPGLARSLLWSLSPGTKDEWGVSTLPKLTRQAVGDREFLHAPILVPQAAKIP
jgi:hypothetical protein